MYLCPRYGAEVEKGGCGHCGSRCGAKPKGSK